MFRKCFGDTNKILCFLTEMISVLPAVRLSFCFFSFFFSLACLVTARADKAGKEQQPVAVAPFLERFFLCVWTCIEPDPNLLCQRLLLPQRRWEQQATLWLSC